ncbi:MAG: Rieske (2Fe-2S) protein [Anaerolineae bacterium]|nr:Rieske (2Fe-2S) protein [Anaerolineae bacterium]
MPDHASTRRKVAVAQVDEIPEGAHKLVQINGRSIGIFNVKGVFVAVLNYCPHAWAPVCQGRVTGTTLPSPPGEYKWGRAGEILACPWHGWEFDLLTGKCLSDKRKLHRYPVTVEENVIYIKV